jgi:hypothetical protein
MLVIGHRPLVGHCINRTRDRDAWLQEGLIRAYNTYAYLVLRKPGSTNRRPASPSPSSSRRCVHTPTHRRIERRIERRIDASIDASTTIRLPVPYLVPVRM